MKAVSGAVFPNRLDEIGVPRNGVLSIHRANTQGGKVVRVARAKVLVGALLCFSAGSCCFDAQTDKPKVTVVDQVEAERWRQDLRSMAQEMPRYHANLFHQTSKEQFDDAIRKLHERIPVLARHQIIVEMARIVAMVGDGHTNVYPTRDPKIGFHALPVQLYFFRDGLFVRAARQDYAHLVGARVLGIGNATIDDAYMRVREIIGRDNEMDVKFFAPHLLVMPEVLNALGFIQDAESAMFSLEQGGKPRQVVLHPAGEAKLSPSDTDTSWMPTPGWVDMRDAASRQAPLWLKDPTDQFWFEYLKDSRTVYCQINRIKDKDTETLAGFSRRLFAFVDANPVDKLVFDLRLNRGGDGSLLSPLITGIIKSKMDERGKVFTIMGRSTWSAAQFLLNGLQKYTNTLFVGEPSGSKGNVYGDSRKITLPNSGVTVRVSVYYWQDWTPWDQRPWTAPDLTAELTSDEYRGNVDPALKTVLNYVPNKPLMDVLNESLTDGGVELAIKKFRQFKADPLHKYAETEDALLLAGQRLLDENKPEQSLELFKLEIEDSPQSFRGYFAMGEAYSRSGDVSQAAKSLEKALELNPKSYDVAEMLKQVRQK